VIRKKHVRAAALGAGLCAVTLPAYAQSGALAAFTVVTLVAGGLVLAVYLMSRAAPARHGRNKKKEAQAGGDATSSKRDEPSDTDAGDAAASGCGGGGGGCGGGGCGS
jgi:hypothetical protein